MAYVSTESGRPLAIENHQLSKSLGLTDRLFVVSNRPLGSRYGRFLPSEYIRRQPSINGFLVRLKRVLAQTEAHQISEPVDLWDLEHYLTQRRKEIDRKYDYRYSQLTQVFGKLLYESRLGEEDLRGLREDKLRSIRSFAKFLAEMDAA